ncbi:hypothetical protein [Azospirillum canadense]|uniref:hypothetical protein n=1 Tax=Azospirillum canadense TaxID=403962 RepID=UPI00222796DC|nr:hypothetical protein [Azospirillum canadense]MCW2240907.1 chromosome segregation ATPase [Azospirillum canadense]
MLEDLVAEVRRRLSQVSWCGEEPQSARIQNTALLEEVRQTLNLWTSHAMPLQRNTEQTATALARISDTLERLTTAVEANQAAQSVLLERLSFLENRIAARRAAITTPTEQAPHRRKPRPAWGAVATTGVAAGLMLLAFWVHASQDALRPMLDRILASL